MSSEHSLATQRRDFLQVAAGAFVAVGAGASLWPLIDQMNPNPATPRLPTLEVDLAPIAPGQVVTVNFRGLPVAIRHRTAFEIGEARAVALSDLRDTLARNAAVPERAPATDANRVHAQHPQWLVVVAACTHLGCLLKPDAADGPGMSGNGWFCPCHAARFDTSGRVRSGPAATNLPVPHYRFLTPTRIEIGAPG